MLKERWKAIIGRTPILWSKRIVIEVDGGTLQV
jgi:hypothetical protein